jgi:hypothetical protein
MKRWFVISLIIFLGACSSANSDNMIVLDYNDFGPQVIASEVIGTEWWQWQAHGDSSPTVYPVKVVVYRGVSLDNVEKRYPVNPTKEHDFRYVEYQNALSFLEQKIEDDVIEDVTSTLKNTRNKILEELVVK